MPRYTANPSCKHRSYKVAGVDFILRYPYVISTLVILDPDDPNIITVTDDPVWNPIYLDITNKEVTTIDNYSMMDIPLNTQHTIKITSTTNSGVYVTFNGDTSTPLKVTPDIMFMVKLDNRFLSQISIEPVSSNAVYSLQVLVEPVSV